MKLSMKHVVVAAALFIANVEAFSLQDGQHLRAARKDPGDITEEPKGLHSFAGEETVEVPAPPPPPPTHGYGRYRIADQQALKAARAAGRKSAAVRVAEEKAAEKEAEREKKEKNKAKKGGNAKLHKVRADGHQNFALGFVVTVILLMIFVMMASSSNKEISKKTWSVLDVILCMFLALEWFVVVKHGLDYMKTTGWERIIYHATLSVIFLVGLLYLSWHMSHDNKDEASVVDGIFGFMVMWVAAGLTETVQMAVGGKNYVLMAVFAMMLWYALVAYVVSVLDIHQMKKGWGDGQVTKMTGAAIAGGFVAWMHMVISGSFQQMAGPHKNPPDFGQTMIMLGMSALYIGLSIFVEPKVAQAAESSSYWKGRALKNVAAILGLLPRFSLFASFGHLIVDNSGIDSGKTEAMLLLTVASTGVGIVLIFLSTLKQENAHLAGMLVGLGGWLIGGAWAKLFDNECDQLLKGRGYSHPFLVKFAFVLFISSFVFPAYINYLKPLIMEKEAGK